MVKNRFSAPRRANPLSQLVNWLYPPACVSCHQTGPLICQICQSTFESAPSERLSPVDIYPLRAVGAALSFSGALRPVVHAFKYGDQRALAEPLAQSLTAAWSRFAWEIDLIVPIPLHPTRERARGYNQSAELARFFAAAIGRPLVLDALLRTRATRPQVELEQTRRQRNVVGAFQGVSSRVAGKQLLLIDDIYTTGATARASAEALLDAGADAIYVYCLARAVSTQDDAASDYQMQHADLSVTPLIYSNEAQRRSVYRPMR